MNLQVVHGSCNAWKSAECRKTAPSLMLSLDSGQLGLWEAECGLWVAECGLWETECELGVQEDQNPINASEEPSYRNTPKRSDSHVIWQQLFRDVQAVDEASRSSKGKTSLVRSVNLTQAGLYSHKSRHESSNKNCRQKDVKWASMKSGRFMRWLIKKN